MTMQGQMLKEQAGDTEMDAIAAQKILADRFQNDHELSNTMYIET
jgi:hypothetical protein